MLSAHTPPLLLTSVLLAAVLVIVAPRVAPAATVEPEGAGQDGAITLAEVAVATISPEVVAAAPDAAAWFVSNDVRSFTETFNGDVGRRAAEGVHSTSGPLVWTSPIEGINAYSGVQFHSGLLFDRSGHLLVPTNRNGSYDELTALDLDDGTIVWRSRTAIETGGVRPGCTSVAEDGTIWTLSWVDAGVPADQIALVALDPLTGQEITSRRIPVGDAFAGGCTSGLHLLPGDRMAMSDPTFAAVHVYDLAAGAQVWEWTPAPGESAADMLLVSADGARLYVVLDADYDGPDLRLVALGAQTGAVVDATQLPGSRVPQYAMATSYVDAEGGVVLVTTEGAPGSEDGRIVRVGDADGWLSLAWHVPAFESAPEDGFAAVPRQLLPGGVDGRTVVAVDVVGRTLVALDLASGAAAWTATQPGSQALLSTEAIADAAGNVLLPWMAPRLVDDVSIPWDVIASTGAPGGTGPLAIFSQIDAFGPLGPDGTLYGVGVVDGATVAFAVAAGIPGMSTLSALPGTVGAGWSTLQLRGVGVASLTRAVLSRGQDQRSAAVVPGATPHVATASFDLRGAALGSWDLTVTALTGEQTLNPVTVEAMDTTAAVSASIVIPDAIKSGFPKEMVITVRNDGNADLNGLPVVVALEDIPLNSVLEAVGVQPSQPPPAGTSWADVPLTAVVDGRIMLPALIPVLGPKQTTVMQLTLTIPPGAAVLETGQAAVHIGDCLATNGRQVPAWVPDQGVVELRATDRAERVYAQTEASFGSCFTQSLSTALGGGAGVLATSERLGERVLPGPVGCLLSVVYAVPSIIQNTAAGAWVPLAWDVMATTLGCIGAFVTALAPAALIGIGVGLLAAALFNCGLDGALKKFLFGSAADPNDIIGPTGAGEQRYLTAALPLDYTIRFENLPEAAFPAGEVVITHTLDADLDPASFLPGPLGWGDVVLTPPAGADSWDEQVLVGGTLVHVAVQRSGAAVTWTLRTIDPATGQPPDDPRDGFLPPNVTAPEGEGFVTFTVEPDPDVIDGTIVTAGAAIVFDANPAITTNTWLNTFDLTPPTGAATPRITPSPSNDITFDLTGSDDVSGVAAWRLALAVDDDQPGLVSARHTADTIRVTAPRGSTIRLAVQAIDGAGNIQPVPSTAEAVVDLDALQRLAGPTRIETAVEISRATFGTAAAVLLARADTYPDALAGAPLAFGLSAPILLTDPAALPTVVAEEVQRLGAATAVILGGETAVSPAVVGTLQQLGLEVTRVAGASRFGTAAAVADHLPAPERVFLVEGAHADPLRGWPDALTVAPLASHESAPILLTTRDALPEETRAALADLGPLRVTIVGGTAAVSETVAEQIRTAGFAVDRLAGVDRYATGLAVLDEAVARGAASPQFTWLATGLNFPDALAAGPAVAATGGRLLLVNGQDPAATPQVLDRFAADAPRTAVLRLAGGQAAIGAGVEAHVRSVLRTAPPR
jgi:outer membrane protein assembly factor BamB